jgi:hypothetical protein
MAFDRLTANANDYGIGFRENVELVAERASLGRASWRVVLWVKVNYKVFFAENGIDIKQISVLIGQGKLWDGTANFKVVHVIVFSESEI